MGRVPFGALYRSLVRSTESALCDKMMHAELTNCRLPSPTKSTVLRSSSASLAARAAPSVAPTDHPIEPHRIWAT